jgi:TRAP-type C4-dicarboxylate transport system permease small subunit
MMEGTSVLKKAYKIFLNTIRGISCTLAIFITCLVVIQVILRYVFKAPLMGIEELLLFPMVWLYMLGGVNASETNTHIECGVLTVYIKSQKAMKLLMIVKSLISSGVGLWLLYWSYWLFDYSLTRWKTSDLLYIPMFYGESSVFIGILLMEIYAIAQLVGYIKEFTDLAFTDVREGNK